MNYYIHMIEYHTGLIIRFLKDHNNTRKCLQSLLCKKISKKNQKEMYKVNNLYIYVATFQVIFTFFVLLKFYTERVYYSYHHKKVSESFKSVIFNIKISYYTKKF